MQVLLFLYHIFLLAGYGYLSEIVILEHSLSKVSRKLCSSLSGIPSSILLRIEMPFVLALSFRLLPSSVRTMVFDLLSLGFWCLSTYPFRSMASTSLVIEFLSFCIWSAISSCDIAPWFQRRSIRRNCSGVRSILCCLSIAAVYCFNLHPAILISTAIFFDSSIGI